MLLVGLAVGGIHEAKAAGEVFPAPAVPLPAPVPAQFDITGFIEEATLDNAGAICHASDPRLAGGTLKVNGIEIVIPCNTLLQMPAATLTWQELFSLAPRDIGLPVANGVPTQTGLALRDSVTLPLATIYGNARLPSYEAHVQGNVVNGRYIAGLVFISQQNLNLGRGRITAIDYENGELHIANADPGVAVARVRINDPQGRFGLTHGAPGSAAALIEPTFDARFAVDADSPTVHAATGYPMCIPRSNPFTDADDPLCPQANRPRSPDCASLPAPFSPFALPEAGQFCTSFVMPDATQQAPFEVGDMIDFMGTLKVDSRGPYISAHTITARLGIYTTPGTMPAYVAIEMQLQGTAALPLANLPQEATSRIKVEGFATDPTRLVDIYAMDVDAASGAISERLIGIANPSGPPVIGRFRFIPAAGAFLPATREFRVVSRTLCGGDPSQPCRVPAAPGTYANGLIAGQYHAPNFEFIFAENLILGDPLLPANFQDMAFLYCGSGPLTTPTAGTTPPQVGQLDPGPWAHPMPDPQFVWTLCPMAKRVDGTAIPVPPVAQAEVAPANVASGETVNLSAAASRDGNTPARPLSFRWTQTAGPLASLSDGNSATPQFSAPTVTATTTLTFSVAVSNNVPLTANASVSVSVNPPPPALSVDIIAPDKVSAGSMVTLTGVTAAGGTVKWIQMSGPKVVLAGANTLSASFIAPRGPSSVAFTLTATTAGGVSTTAMRSIAVAPDGVSMLPVTWVRSEGALSIVATSTALAAGMTTAPAGMSMTAMFWNRNLPASARGGAGNPVLLPMSFATGTACASATPCFVGAASGVIVDPASPPEAPVLLEPTSVVVRSSFGGSATVSTPAIRIR
jgi:hypothetical protein